MIHCLADYIETVHGDMSSDSFLRELAELSRRYGRAELRSGALLRFMSKTCWLEAGHEGPHEWTDDRDVMITFSEEAID